MKVFLPAAKFIAVWLALIVIGMLAGMLGAPSAPPITTTDPLTAVQAEIIVSGLFAALLSILAAHIKLAFRSKLITLFVIFYGVENVMSEIEAIYFNASLHLSSSALVYIAVSGALTAAVGAAVTAWLWPANRAEPMPALSGLAWKVPVIIPLYIVFYLGAGGLIAWQSPVVRAYYANGAHFDMVGLLLLQVLRGAMWAGLAAVAVKSVSGSGMFRALMTGLSFAVFAVAPLLYPNAFMPWPVRQMHIIEILVSNLMFGYLAASILLSGRKAAKPAP